jgi:hypothetical protein
MNESEIIKRNEAIALFMGNNGSLYCDHCRKPYPETFPNGRLTKCCSTYDKGHKNAFYSTMDESGSVVYSIGKRTSRDLKYHSSWNWLMPVVRKIEEQEEIDRNKALDANGTAPRYCYPYRVDIINRNYCEILAFGEDLITSATGETKLEAVFLAVSDYCMQILNEQ